MLLINSLYLIINLKKDLKISETKKVLLGTYPMANEGLDIPSLNGLILGTPKSDIIQTVGRICRMKHKNIQPLIIDLVDNFSVFENQARKRMDLYRKNKYEVEDIKFDMDINKILERKKYHYHNIIIKSGTSKKCCEIGDKNIKDYYEEIQNNNEIKEKKKSNKTKKEELFTMFDDVF